MDHLRIERAHVVGASMGGMVAQELACAAPSRVATLTLVFTSPGPGVGLLPAPMATQLWIQWHNTRCAAAMKAALAAGSDVAAAARPYKVAVAGRIKTRAFFCEEDVLAHLAEAVARSDDDSGKARQVLTGDFSVFLLLATHSLLLVFPLTSLLVA